MNFRLLAVFSAVLILGTGCAGYRLGPTAEFPAGGRSVKVAFFKNGTLEPRLVSALNHALRKQLQQDGTYRLSTRDDADVVITGTILKFNRAPISFVSADVITARDYDVTLLANITATDRSTGKVLMDREIGGRTTLRIGTDLASAERQAVPLAATDLARNATSYLVDGNW
jgi:hypothetical protein